MQFEASSVQLSDLVRELIERMRQIAYDEGKGDAVSISMNASASAGFDED